MKNYYTILGISSTADASEIKSAFRRLSKVYHPDRHRGEGVWEDEFKNVSEAYTVLSDAGRREVYDRRLFAWAAGVYTPSEEVVPVRRSGVNIRYLVAAVLLLTIITLLLLINY
ncbi:DnaJ domain-containing protein [uncultured Chitinophaga sp.]|uniref:J domain-containing protein n=1 Tax=uncultured Chitinophaga sp. TaxID=339340 RepID=UPI0025CC33D4|nr:DnaJ domain-containing protein [uncultured Chitinophaga sp.]